MNRVSVVFCPYISRRPVLLVALELWLVAIARDASNEVEVVATRIVLLAC